MGFVEIATAELRFLTRDYGFRLAEATPESVTYESDHARVEVSLDEAEVTHLDSTVTRSLLSSAATSLQKDDAILRDQPPKQGIHSFRRGGLTLILRIRRAERITDL
jgi:hypothetical protein